jgi:hypothetical protein
MLINTTRQNWLIATVAIVMVCSVMGTLSSCNEKKTRNMLGSYLAPFLPVVVESVLNDPQVKASIGEGGEPLARAAVAVMLPLLQNEVSKLSLGSEDERLAYKRITKENPDLAAMLYRVDDNGVAQGLWPRLNAWLSLKGYGTAAQLWRELAGTSPVIRISPVDRDELKDLMGPAIVEEYLAVKAGKAHYSLPDFESEH